MSSQKEGISRRSLLSRGVAIVGVVAVPAVLVSRPAFAISREALHYTENSATPANTCANCMSFIPPATPAVAGGCFILKGAISPKGHCDGWSAKTR